MKKANKKINKFLKVTLLLCMIFSQLASPIKVLADVIVPSYNVDIVLDTENDNFLVTSNGTELVEDKNYILEVNRSFRYSDNSLNEEENITEYKLVLGSILTAGVNLEHDTFSHNGTSYVDINVHEVNDDTIDFSTYTDEDYKNLLTTDKVVKIANTSFEEGISSNKTGILFEINGESVVCDTNDGYKCEVTKNDTNNIVNINYTILDGNLNPNKEYYMILKTNGITMDVLDGAYDVDFSKLLSDNYNMEFELRDNNGVKVLANNIDFNYLNSEEVDRIEFIKNSELALEAFFSYTVLTEEEKVTLGNEYRFLDNPFAFLTDAMISESGELSANYSLFDEENRYHVITSENLLGAFNDESKAYRVSDVKELLGLNQYRFINFSIVDANGQVVEDNTYIQNGMKLVIDVVGEKIEYDFLVYSDVDGGYVEESDLSTLIDKVLNNDFSYYDLINLNLNGDEEIDVKDISLLGRYIYDKDYAVYTVNPVDTIDTILSTSTTETFVGETFEVILSLKGFNNDFINAIEGYVDYDKTALRLDKVESLNELFIGNYLDNRFIFASSETYDVNEEEFVKLTFTALTEGTHTLSVSETNLVADGVVINSNNSNEVEVKVNRNLHTDARLKNLNSSVGYFDKAFDSEILEYTLYVDSYVTSVTLSGELNDIYAKTEDLKEYQLTGDNTLISVNVVAEDGTVRTYKINVVKVYKSSNNNLSDIVIDGYEIDFNKDTLEYKINVGSDVTSLDIRALVEDPNAWAKIEGNENFKEGENIVSVTVYAQDGTPKTYKLLVNKAKKVDANLTDGEDKDTDDKESSINTEKVVIIVLIILVVIGLLYLIFKKDEDNEEPRIEQIKPKKEETKNNNKEVKNNNKSKKSKK